MTRDQETEALMELAAEGEPSPLLQAMLGLSDRLKRTRKRELAFRAFVLAVLVALFVLGNAALSAGNKAQRAIDRADAERAARTVGACNDANEAKAQARQQAAAVLTKQGESYIATLTALVPNPDPNPAKTAASLAVLNQANDANTAKAIAEVQAGIGFKHLDGSIYPTRDCSPLGIELFFSEQKAIADKAAAGG